MEIVQPGGSGTGTALTVTDGTNTVTPVSTIDFISAATVSSGGAGIANVTINAAVGYQTCTGTVNGTNRTFVFVTAPNVVSVDGVDKRKTQSDGTVNWTGITTIVLAIAPTFDVFGVN